MSTRTLNCRPSLGICSLYLFLVWLVSVVAVPTVFAGDPTPLEDVPVLLPDDYDPASPAPLLIMLHRFGADGPTQESILGLAPHANTRGYIYAYPTGSVNPNGTEYWNGAGCCDFFGENPDHVGYVNDLIDYLEATYSVDPNRIHLLGYSNGGFLSFRIACETADRLASVFAIAAVTWNNPALCPGDDPVHIAYMIGTNDNIYTPGGGSPGAENTVQQWVDLLKCGAGVTDPDLLDAIDDVGGAETEITRYTDCEPGASFEFWKVNGGRHIMALNDTGRQAIFDYLDSHAKVAPCPADLTGDGAVGPADLAQVLGAWGPYAPCPPVEAADLDEDCDVDAADLAIVLGTWGPC